MGSHEYSKAMLARLLYQLSWLATAAVPAVAGPEADLDVFEGSRLWVIPSNVTLTFEHTYTWWGESLAFQ